MGDGGGFCSDGVSAFSSSLSPSPCRLLQGLDLSANGLSASAAQLLGSSALPLLPGLTWLRLSGNGGMGDEGCLALLTALLIGGGQQQGRGGCCPGLTCLDLSSCGLQRTGLTRLAQLLTRHPWPTLRELSLAGNLVKGLGGGRDQLLLPASSMLSSSEEQEGLGAVVSAMVGSGALAGLCVLDLSFSQGLVRQEEAQQLLTAISEGGAGPALQRVALAGTGVSPDTQQALAERLAGRGGNGRGGGR